MQEHGPIRFFSALPFFSLRKTKDGGRPKLWRQLNVSYLSHISWMMNGMDGFIEYAPIYTLPRDGIMDGRCDP